MPALAIAHGPIARAAVFVAMLSLAAAGPASAQRTLSPIIELDAGVRTVDVVSSESSAGSASGFNLRVRALIPDAWRHVDVFVAAELAPFGLSNNREDENDPAFLYGVSIPLLAAKRTGGWLSIGLPVMGYYRYDPTGIESPRRRYVNDIMVEGTITLHLGQKMLSDLGAFWSTLDAYLYVDQPITKTIDPATLRVDRFRPAFVYGLSVPVAGSRDDR